jgi:hypothetical protein
MHSVRMRIRPERFPHRRRIHITYICMLKQTNLEATSYRHPRQFAATAPDDSFRRDLEGSEKEDRVGCLLAQLLTSPVCRRADLSTRSRALVSCFSPKPQLDRGATQVYIATAARVERCGRGRAIRSLHSCTPPLAAEFTRHITPFAGRRSATAAASDPPSTR